MSRLVELEETGPLKLDLSDIDDEKGDVAVCRCGLSDEFPFCDGSHRTTEDEAPGERYRYDEDGTRRRVERIVLADEEESEGDDGTGDREESEGDDGSGPEPDGEADSVTGDRP